MEKMISFKEYLQARDEEMFNEINFQDITDFGKNAYKVGKNAWTGAGNLVGKKARNYAAAGLLGAGALAYGMSGNPDAELVSKHNNITSAQAVQMQQEDPSQFKMLVNLARTREKVNDLRKSVNTELGKKNIAPPKDGHRWDVPDTHYQSPFHEPSEPSSKKVSSSQDTINQIDSIIGRK